MQIQMHDMENIQQLAFVGMQAFCLAVEDRIHIYIDIECLFHIVSQDLLAFALTAMKRSCRTGSLT